MDKVDGLINNIDEWMNGQTYRWMDGRVDGLID